MKNTQVCPKCNAREILIVSDMRNSSNTIFIGSKWRPHQVRLEQHICTSCGYVEEWVTSPDSLEALKQEYNSQ
jgi:predicted nucleic-acid-binding Zn-ribbon protein